MIVGGTGVFGRYIVEELLKSTVDFSITVAGRSEVLFQKYYSKTPKIKFIKADLNDIHSLENLLSQTQLIIIAAGPFQNFSPDIALKASFKGVHYIDLCDDVNFITKIYENTSKINSDSIILSGMSSLPGISLLLMEKIRNRFNKVNTIQIGLFIGNKNQKGRGAILSAVKNLSHQTTFLKNGVQEKIQTWSEKIDYNYPEPMGAVCAYSFPTPDLLLFSKYYSFQDFTTHVSFESLFSRRALLFFKHISKCGYQKWVEKMVNLLSPFFTLSSFFGTEIGCVSVTVCGEKAGKKNKIRSSLVGYKNGQRMASLPAVIAAEAIARGEVSQGGLLNLTDWMDCDVFFDRMKEKGMNVLIDEIL